MLAQKKTIYWLSFIIIIILVFAALLPFCGRYTESVDRKTRIRKLKFLYEKTYEYVKCQEPRTNITLFDILSVPGGFFKGINWNIIVLPGTDDSITFKYPGKNISDISRSEFYTVCQYRLYWNTSKKWFIIENQKGLRGDYHLSIGQNGEIFKTRRVL
jgi:hypothetical protein